MYITEEYTSHWTRADYDQNTVVADLTNTGDDMLIYRHDDKGHTTSWHSLSPDQVDAIMFLMGIK